MPSLPATHLSQVKDRRPTLPDHLHQINRRKDIQRGSASKRGYGTRWRKARLMYLAEHPLCEVCLPKGITEAATVVDHITPHKGDYDLFWDEGNWQSLSKRCHDRKTIREQHA